MEEHGHDVHDIKEDKDIIPMIIGIVILAAILVGAYYFFRGVDTIKIKETPKAPVQIDQKV